MGTATYALSGGTVAGQVDFSSLFALAGTGVVTSTAKLIGSSGSTMTQAGGAMGGTVTGVTSYTQSGGAMNGFVNGIASYAQSPGTMGGTVTALGYEQSGGLLLQGGSANTQVAALNASASNTDYGVGVYGGREFGGTLLSFGATYTRHDNIATRHVSFPSFTYMLSANYASGTSSVFANVSHEFDFGAVSLKPYAGLAYVSHATDSFSETGGPAALSSAANVIDATFASLGVGVEQQFVVGEDMLLTASGSVG